MSVPYSFTAGTIAESAKVNSNFTYVDKALVPIGSIIPFYDYNGALTFDTSYWAYCNGQTKTITGIGAQTLPDLSNRYLVGFGTEGGADNGSAAWSTTPVGNASHQVNLSHDHTSASHNHTSSGNLYALIGSLVGYSGIALSYTSKTISTFTANRVTGTSVSSATVTGRDEGVPVYGTSDNTTPANTGSALSATQSIQPRSVLVRYIMRIA